jgi:hypothetical protein
MKVVIAISFLGMLMMALVSATPVPPGNTGGARQFPGGASGGVCGWLQGVQGDPCRSLRATLHRGQE